MSLHLKGFEVVLCFYGSVMDSVMPGCASPREGGFTVEDHHLLEQPCRLILQRGIPSAYLLYYSLGFFSFISPTKGCERSP